jgi:hypothetical protein
MGTSGLIEKAKTQLQPFLLIKAIWPILVSLFTLFVGSWYWKTLQKQFIFIGSTWQIWSPMTALLIFIISIVILYYKHKMHKNMEFVLEEIEVSMMIVSLKEFEYKSKKFFKALRSSKVRIPYVMGWTGTDQILDVRVSDFSKNKGVASTEIFGPTRINSKKNTWMFLTELCGSFEKNDHLWVEVATDAGDSDGEVEDFIGSRIPAYGLNKVSLRLTVKRGAVKPDRVVMSVRDETGTERLLTDHAEWQSGHDGLESVLFEKHNPVPSWQYLLRWFYLNDPRHVERVTKSAEKKAVKLKPDLTLAMKKAGGASIKRAFS